MHVGDIVCFGASCRLIVLSPEPFRECKQLSRSSWPLMGSVMCVSCMHLFLISGSYGNIVLLPTAGLLEHQWVRETRRTDASRIIRHWVVRGSRQYTAFRSKRFHTTDQNRCGLGIGALRAHRSDQCVLCISTDSEGRTGNWHRQSRTQIR